MKALVLAAGVGERMRPLTDELPKPLLPIANRPVMGYILEHLARHGFTEVVANLYYRGEDIAAHFQDGAACGVELRYSWEDRLYGSAGGTKRCQDFLGDDTFLVIGSDDLTDMDLTALLRLHREAGAIASIGLVEVEETSQFGIVVTEEDGRIKQFVEKPKGYSPSKTANTQIYLFEPEILDLIPPDQVWDYGFNVFPELVSSGAPFYGFSLPGYWRDIGSVADYLVGQSDVLAQLVQARVEGTQARPGVWIGEGAEISPQAEISGPAMIGRGCRVEAGARVGGGASVADGVVVPARTCLRNTVVWSGASVPEGEEIRDCVITPQRRVSLHPTVS